MIAMIVLTNSLNLRNISLKRNYLISLIVYSLAEELLAKESIGLPDILRVLGERPYAMKDSVKEYLVEMQEREVQDEQKKTDDAAAEKEKAETEAEEKAEAAETPADELEKKEEEEKKDKKE